ncbi:hypothetical protein KJ969_05135 [Patescibacteria group bacterium]|nr:hypothetical protein [Patescibacteria group bacterium]MBU1921606.1 hypothetical protein [Patescibacteria group bacterium]
MSSPCGLGIVLKGSLKDFVTRPDRGQVSLPRKDSLNRGLFFYAYLASHNVCYTTLLKLKLPTSDQAISAPDNGSEQEIAAETPYIDAYDIISANVAIKPCKFEVLLMDIEKIKTLS